jgi:hypothetical protein
MLGLQDPGLDPSCWTPSEGELRRPTPVSSSGHASPAHRIPCPKGGRSDCADDAAPRQGRKISTGTRLWASTRCVWLPRIRLTIPVLPCDAMATRSHPLDLAVSTIASQGWSLVATTPLKGTPVSFACRSRAARWSRAWRSTSQRSSLVSSTYSGRGVNGRKRGFTDGPVTWAPIPFSIRTGSSPPGRPTIPRVDKATAYA